MCRMFACVRKIYMCGVSVCLNVATRYTNLFRHPSGTGWWARCVWHRVCSEIQEGLLVSGVVVVPLRSVGRGTLDFLAEVHSSGVVGHVSTTMCAQRWVHQYSRFVCNCFLMSGGECALRLIPSSSTPSSCFLISYLVTRACGFVASSV